MTQPRGIEMTKNLQLKKRVFMLFSTDCNYPIGTGFGVIKPEIVLTANHVVKNHKHIHVVSTFYNPLLICKVNKIITHPSADISALIIEEKKPLEYFEIGKPPYGYKDFPLGEEVLSYGFPMLKEKPIPPRMMKGHIQRQFQYKDDEYHYSAYELGFPSFHGQSGSPIFSDLTRNIVIGMVTRWTTFQSEERGDIVSASWAIGASLIPITDWIDSL